MYVCKYVPIYIFLYLCNKTEYGHSNKIAVLIALLLRNVMIKLLTFCYYEYKYFGI